MSLTATEISRAQILRQQCNRVFSGKDLHAVIGALEMLVVDAVLSVPGQDESTALSGMDAVMADIRNIVRERFAAKRAAN